MIKPEKRNSNSLSHNKDPDKNFAFENIVGKGENAGNHNVFYHLKVFPTMFSTT